MKPITTVDNRHQWSLAWRNRTGNWPIAFRSPNWRKTVEQINKAGLANKPARKEIESE